ncbi:hypothetical protein WAI453_012687 [Rhynchosporium graminicola]
MKPRDYETAEWEAGMLFVAAKNTRLFGIKMYIRTIAPAETTAKPEQPEPPKVDHKPGTAQNPDPATTGHLQRTVSKANELTDPAMEETLRVTSSS